jgi:hypothetical protein
MLHYKVSNSRAQGFVSWKYRAFRLLLGPKSVICLSALAVSLNIQSVKFKIIK